MVIAGINAGANVGINLNYSGTVAAAKEAALQGLPAMAVSICGTDHGHYDEAAAFTGRLAERLSRRGMPAGTFLNVNFPGRPLSQTAGVRVRRQGLESGPDRFERRVDPRKRVYFWPGGDPAATEEPATDADTDSDRVALSAAFITITPIRCDMTDYDLLAELRGWVSERL
jgi:5'-nucleotidase